MGAKPVIAIIDVGKTNKKLFLFDQQYNIVYERSARFIETVDEDGDACENLESLRLSVFDSLRSALRKKEFSVKALNFSAYGASFVYLDEAGHELTPLYNYLKPFPKNLQEQFYNKYGGEATFSLCCASPILGSLNSGMQLYRLKYEKPEVFKAIKHALHLPQYLSYLVSCKAASEITSIGCHTNLWNFNRQDYHDWVYQEGIAEKLPPIVDSDETTLTSLAGKSFLVGPGLHDSSAALIPYLVSFREPFILLSTGTWCISLNPFNDSPLSEDELKQDCLCYLQYKGKPVKASRLFTGQEHEDQVQRIAAHFNQNVLFYRSVVFNPATARMLQRSTASKPVEFASRDLSLFSSVEEAYHQLIFDLVEKQIQSTNLVLKGTAARRIFVDGGFSRNPIFMNLLAQAYADKEIFAASMPQATALGAAIAIHKSWNKQPMSTELIEIKYYSGQLQEV